MYKNQTAKVVISITIQNNFLYQTDGTKKQKDAVKTAPFV